MQRIGQAFYGRARAYRSALSADDEAALAEALTRNVYEGSPPTPEVSGHLAAYVREAVRDVRAQRVDDLVAGKLNLPKP
jgi:cytochrome b pre-mRNA-processing protein 3